METTILNSFGKPSSQFTLFGAKDIPFSKRDDQILEGYENPGKDNINIAIYNYEDIILDTTIVDEFSISATSSEFLELDILLNQNSDEEAEYDIQGIGKYPQDLGVEGFQQEKDLDFYVLTDKQISSIQIPSISTSFLFEYSSSIKGYIPELKQELESLCRMIMVEDDTNLTVEAIVLKKDLKDYFQEIV